MLNQEDIMDHITARDKAISIAMQALYGSHGPGAHQGRGDAIRRIMGAVFDAGKDDAAGSGGETYDERETEASRTPLWTSHPAI